MINSSGITQRYSFLCYFVRDDSMLPVNCSSNLPSLRERFSPEPVNRPRSRSHSASDDMLSCVIEEEDETDVVRRINSPEPPKKPRPKGYTIRSQTMLSYIQFRHFYISGTSYPIQRKLWLMECLPFSLHEKLVLILTNGPTSDLLLISRAAEVFFRKLK